MPLQLFSVRSSVDVMRANRFVRRGCDEAIKDTQMVQCSMLVLRHILPSHTCLAAFPVDADFSAPRQYRLRA
jgi:hypothetical protein